MAARVFVFGSINTDLVVYVERLPVPGETVAGGTWGSFPGGKGANQAVAAARAGAAVAADGCLGDDAFGKEPAGRAGCNGNFHYGGPGSRGGALGCCAYHRGCPGGKLDCRCPGGEHAVRA